MAIFIGTSGFSYHHWTEKFYPKVVKQSDWLAYYAEHFNTVEINSSFYRLPNEKVFSSWYDKTPGDFSFSVKGSRYITHTKRLLVEKDSVNLFMERAESLGSKLKVVLWQFPPGFKVNPKRLERFLKLLKIYKCRFAFEFRHESWLGEPIYKILRAYNAALAIADSPHFPKTEIQTADFSYIRFHGGKYLYSSKYSPGEMKDWSKKIEKLSKKGNVFAYFNNDANAFAVKNALEMKENFQK